MAVRTPKNLKFFLHVRHRATNTKLGLRSSNAISKSGIVIFPSKDQKPHCTVYCHISAYMLGTGHYLSPGGEGYCGSVVTEGPKEEKSLKILKGFRGGGDHSNLLEQCQTWGFTKVGNSFEGGSLQ